MDDLRALAAYRDEVAEAGRRVLATVRAITGDQYSLSERARKTTNSIVAKLQRQSLTLGQMHDISGCRLVVPDRLVSDEIAKEIASAFSGSRIIDRRVKPSHGYRALHVIVYNDGYPYEIQIRTTLENAWAQLSEKAADKYGFQLKYGGGPNEIEEVLEWLSEEISKVEDIEFGVSELERENPGDPDIEELRQGAAEARAGTEEVLARAKELIQ